MPWGIDSLRANKIENFSTVEMSFLKQSRIDCVENWDFRSLQLLRLRFWNCEEFLDCQDVFFVTVKNFLTVEMSFLKLSGIYFFENWYFRAFLFLRLCFWNYWDQESRSKLCRDKLRPPGLVPSLRQLK
jgi:hypothetical protein